MYAQYIFYNIYITSSKYLNTSLIFTSNMALSGKTNIMKNSGSSYVRVPKDIAEDSQFPFKEDDLLDIIIIEGRLEIKKSVENAKESN